MFTSTMRMAGGALLGIGMAMPSIAQANLAYTAGTSNFTVQLGSTVNVPIYIQEFGATKEISNDGGLFSAGFSMQQVAPIPAASATIANATSNTTLFDTQNIDTYDPDANTASLSLDQSGGSIASAAVPTNGLLLVGTLTFNAGASTGATAFSISVTDPTFRNAQTITYNADALDSQIALGNFTVTTVPLPEPSILGVLGVVSTILSVRRRD